MKEKKFKKPNFVTISDDDYSSRFIYIPEGSSQYETKWVHKCDNPQPCECPKMGTMKDAGITVTVEECACEE